MISVCKFTKNQGAEGFFFLHSSGIYRSYGWLSTSFSLRLTLFAEDDIPGGLLFLFDTYLYLRLSAHRAGGFFFNV